ncbi:amidase [Brevibacillus reuszeri]|uniref:amidase n=1 Tax=Brevibacillus reuszeri TaxID=54915 RepID=UPI00289E06D6|nr:amidase [Brevibacillus reuszeri]
MDLLTLSQSYEEKKVSPVEIVQQVLSLIEQENPACNAYITICEEEALAAASQAEKEIMSGNKRGPLHGVPIAMKDLIFTKNILTTMGSKVYEHFVPDFDATVVQKCKDAGAIILGKTNTHEFAYGPIGDRSYFGPSRNPYDLEKITGGSSGGSGAAVAANLAYAALGTDTGGSIRIPASACGVVGMKPTFGLVSKFGVFNLAYTLDHVGPMTKTVKDNAALLNLLAGQDEKDPYSFAKATEDYSRLIGQEIKGKVIGLPRFFFQNIEEEVRVAVEKAIAVYQSLGAEIREVEIGGIDEIAEGQRITIQAEAYAVHEKTMREHADEIDAEVRERLVLSKEVRGYEYVQVQQRRQQLIRQFNESFQNVDVLLTPTLPIVPTDIYQREVMIGHHAEGVRQALLRLTSPTNFTGNPGLSIPCGFSKGGLPIGFQLIGKHLEEAQLYQFGYGYEKAASMNPAASGNNAGK